MNLVNVLPVLGSQSDHVPSDSHSDLFHLYESGYQGKYLLSSLTLSSKFERLLMAAST